MGNLQQFTAFSLQHVDIMCIEVTEWWSVCAACIFYKWYFSSILSCVLHLPSSIWASSVWSVETGRWTQLTLTPGSCCPSKMAVIVRVVLQIIHSQTHLGLETDYRVIQLYTALCVYMMCVISGPSLWVLNYSTYEERCDRNRNRGQGQVITSHCMLFLAQKSSYDLQSRDTSSNTYTI